MPPAVSPKAVAPHTSRRPSGVEDVDRPGSALGGWQGVLTGAVVFSFVTLGAAVHARAERGGTAWLASTVLLGFLLAALTAGTCARIAVRAMARGRRQALRSQPRRRARSFRGMSSTGNWFSAGALFAGVGGSLATQPILLVAAVAAAAAVTTAIGYLHDHERASESSERQRMRDLFGRYVGEDVASCALSSSTELTGQEVEVGVLFVDLADSTRLASVLSPSDVALLLNEFFRIVVDTVSRYGGFVNKFEGDAALVVFGAPRELGDSSGAALGAARDLRDALADHLASSGFGIGVSAGRVFAGQVGAPTRMEYTVIGDPVNEAARLTELAKAEVGHVLASAAAVDGASPMAASSWIVGEKVELRGRSAATLLARPAASGAESGQSSARGQSSSRLPAYAVP